MVGLEVLQHRPELLIIITKTLVEESVLRAGAAQEKAF